MVVSNPRSKQASSAARPVEHKDDARREEILVTAQALFAEQGFRETNLNQIAVELGFRRQAVYHYFSSKDELLYELISRAGEAMKSSSKEVFDADLPPEAALGEVVRNHVRVLLSMADVYRIQFAELNKLSGKRAQGLRDDMAAYIHRVAEVIEAGQKSGVFTDGAPMPLALLIIGMCNFTTEWYNEERSHLSIDEVADYAAGVALSGLSQKRPPARRGGSSSTRAAATSGGTKTGTPAKGRTATTAKAAASKTAKNPATAKRGTGAARRRAAS